ncbi:hypothetical protein GMOD_00008447 [Pyrenophora seminiperda CCB06]|uniref:Uncharacterized protein n=1 Tax=Pyrenophora seminiperda CCB06 TaxID=1302712 RepID=A0A3M7M8V7_9PLEO|nr:hypothetical protein GMOD_00008447 [Pyrenophora seminiperda CCB06]
MKWYNINSWIFLDTLRDLYTSRDLYTRIYSLFTLYHCLQYIYKKTAKSVRLYIYTNPIVESPAEVVDSFYGIESDVVVVRLL